MRLALSSPSTWALSGAIVLSMFAFSCGDGGSGSGGSTGGTTASGGTGTGGSTGGTGGMTTGGSGGATGGTGGMSTAGAGGTGGAASLCTTSGGTEGTGLCCTGTSDYPDGCGTGPCGCSPDNSHEVKVCVCPDTQCFDPAVGCK